MAIMMWSKFIYLSYMNENMKLKKLISFKISMVQACLKMSNELTQFL